jgi:hypothetical protein
VRRDDLLQANDDHDGLDVERGGWTETREGYGADLREVDTGTEAQSSAGFAKASGVVR